MVSVYLLNLIIYISLNPIKLAVYHIKIALSWLSPVRLNYCWRESYSSVLLYFPPKKGPALPGMCSKKKKSTCPVWCVLVVGQSWASRRRQLHTHILLTPGHRGVTEISRFALNFPSCSWGLIKSSKCGFMAEGSSQPGVLVDGSSSGGIILLCPHLLRVQRDVVLAGVF